MKWPFVRSSQSREFPCPHCTAPVVVLNVDEKGAATLRHPPNGCKAPASDLLRAYVHAMKPKLRFPKMESIAEKLWNTHERERKGG